MYVFYLRYSHLYILGNILYIPIGMIVSISNIASIITLELSKSDNNLHIRELNMYIEIVYIVIFTLYYILAYLRVAKPSFLFLFVLVLFLNIKI